MVRAPGQPETTFLGADVAPDAAAWAAAASALTTLPDLAGFAFCGSAPGWTDPAAELFRTAISACLHCGTQVFVDTYGPPLRWFATQPVALVKINRQELSALHATHDGDASAATQGTASALQENLATTATEPPPDPRRAWPSVRTWIITDGPRPTWLFESALPPAAFAPPPITEVSPTGSGDVLLAALIHARSQRGLDWPAALRFALPLASANAAHPGVADFPWSH